MHKPVEVTIVSRVKSIEEMGGLFRIALFYSTREFFVDKQKDNILKLLRMSKENEIPITVIFDGKTGSITDVKK